jgi:hypothetical protein
VSDERFAHRSWCPTCGTTLKPTPSPDVRPCPGIRVYESWNDGDGYTSDGTETKHCEGCPGCAPGGRGELTPEEQKRLALMKEEYWRQEPYGRLIALDAIKLFAIIDRLTGGR